MRRRCKQVAREVARITSSGQDATTIVYALEEYGRQVAPWAEDVMLKIVEMSDQQNLGMWRELSGKLAEKLQTLTTKDAVAQAIRELSLEGARLYVDLFPCNECAKAIIQSGIRNVVYDSDKYAEADSTIASKKMFDAAGVTYRQYERTGRKISIEL